MPEGDTLFRTAHVLRQAIGGRVLTGFRSPLLQLREANLVGRTVTTVEARGKNLLIHFDDGQVLYTHLRMEGSWHIYRPGERWQRPERQARVVLETDAFVAICFNAPTVQLLTEKGVERHQHLASLGPDLLGPEFDYGEAVRRMRERNGTPIGEVVMRQNTISGIGNVYKSEVLFILKINPWTKVQDLSDHDLKLILSKSRELMQKNTGGGDRITRVSLDGGRQWVYGRSGQPCRKCGTSIRMKRQGLEARSTYWCPKCQSGVAEN